VAATVANVPALLISNFNRILNVLTKTIEVDQKELLVAMAGKLVEMKSDEPEFEVDDGAEEMEVGTEEDAANTKKNEMISETDREVANAGNLLSAQRTAIDPHRFLWSAER
jgi:hypothetical protein